MESINWYLIQLDYDKGLSLTELKDKYGTSEYTVRLAAKKGLLKLRTRSESGKLHLKLFPRKPSAETKRKISEGRTKYLKANPDKVPYLLNHSSKKSYPEKLFENALLKYGINNYYYNFQQGLMRMTLRL